MEAEKTAFNYFKNRYFPQIQLISVNPFIYSSYNIKFTDTWSSFCGRLQKPFTLKVYHKNKLQNLNLAVTKFSFNTKYNPVELRGGVDSMMA